MVRAVDAASQLSVWSAPTTAVTSNPRMKAIAAGYFLRPDTARISAFHMDSTEVTQTDYLALMGVNPSYFSYTMNDPVMFVTWFDAVLYCNALSKLKGFDTVYTYSGIAGIPGNGCSQLTDISIDYAVNGYRLPTEAEWEYACRAGTATTYYWGDLADTAYAWYNMNCIAHGPYPVATRLPNAWGLYDMSGNVSEYVNDWLDAPYPSGTLTDPVGPSTGTYKLSRGGDYNSSWMGLPSASRDNWTTPDNRYPGSGFRVVLKP
jgi:formylglycine-generating enzyme required for sulfatase activity